MPNAASVIAHRVEPEALETISILGPTIQFLTPPDGDDASPCVMRGTIPGGVSIPLHSHADPEVFLAHSGQVEGLAVSGDRFEWIRIGPGDVFHVPGGAKHAFRNQGREPAVMTVVSTSKIGRFFKELGVPGSPGSALAGPPSPEQIRHFQETAGRYGYWNATPEENARFGVPMPAI